MDIASPGVFHMALFRISLGAAGAASIVLSHEIFETNDNGEIGDICAPANGVSTGKVVLDSNKSHGGSIEFAVLSVSSF
jgi:hypothetical protein